MDHEKTVILLVQEAKEYFEGCNPEELQNLSLVMAKDANELLKFVYVYNPHFILFDIANLTEDNYTALLELKKEKDLARYQMLFIRSHDEAKAILKAFQNGANPYYLKVFNMVEKNARILDYMELRQARNEMTFAFNELRQANQEVKKKNKQLQQAISNVEKLTTTDYLTGVYNRRYVIDRIKHEIIRYKRTKRIFSFVICDIDNFKTINDTYGHAYGDLLLIETAKYLSDSCREIDVLSRWGGDEFLFVLPETDLAGAKVFCERVRTALSEKVFSYGHSDMKISMTFGVSEYNDNDGVNDSIKNADNALMDGKQSGKDMVVTFKGVSTSK